MPEQVISVLNYISNVYMQGFIGIYSTGWGTPGRIAAYIGSVIIIMVSAYLLGSINFAIIISATQYKQDIRNFGSNNAGMTNMMRTYGKKAAAFTLIGDAVKAIVACFIAYLFIGQLGAYIAGIFCMLGHIFPIYYNFKGGKGVVTAGATIFMCNPIVFLIIITMFAIIVLFTKYISLASIMCMLLYPVLLHSLDPVWLRMVVKGTHGSVGIPFAVIMTVMVVIKHWTNIKRLLNGTESKFSFKKSVKKPVDGEKSAETVEEDKTENK